MKVKRTSCSNFPRPNGPNWLIRNDNLFPTTLPNSIMDLAQLLRHNLHRASLLPLLQTLATAQNHPDTAVNGRLGLAGHELVFLFENGAALRVPDQGPTNVGVFELRDGDLAGEGTVGLVKDVLCSDLHVVV